MIDRARLLEIAEEEAFSNPRTAPYDVRRLYAQPQAYPFRTDDGAIPAVVMQFAVENRHDARARRVISLSRSALGYSVWCGDRFTEGRLDGIDTEELIQDAVLQVPGWTAERAYEEMHGVEAAYPFFAACHFWKAWHSHQGLCKHVAAALQFLENHHDDGLEGALDVLDAAYEDLMEPTITLDLVLPDLGEEPVDKLRVRGEVMALAAEVAAPVGGLTTEQHQRLQDLLDALANE